MSSPAQPPPEIHKLEGNARWLRGVKRVHLSDAERAVRDTEARVRDHYALSGRALREVGEAARNSTLTDTQKVDVIAGVLANGPLDDAPGGPCEDAVFAARREAFREAVEALRSEAAWHSRVDQGGHDVEPEEALAYFIERSFLSHPDNPEGNA